LVVAKVAKTFGIAAPPIKDPPWWKLLASFATTIIDRTMLSWQQRCVWNAFHECGERMMKFRFGFTGMMIASGAVFLSAVIPVMAQDRAKSDAPAGENKTLDQQLLEGLDSGLLDDLEGLSADNGPDATEGDEERPSDLDADLTDQLLEGDDLGMGDDVDPLTRIARRMQIAQERIRTKRTSNTTQRVQQEIIDELARLIEEARKSQCKGGGPGQPQMGQPNQKNSGDPKGANNQSRTPANDSRPTKSTDRVDKGDSAEADTTRRRALVKEIWGQLPERVRGEIPNTGDEEFLPKYADVIEDYFERLANEGRETP
jgi:hypothetical protein